MKTKLMAMLMALAMIVSMVPMVAAAEGEHACGFDSMESISSTQHQFKCDTCGAKKPVAANNAYKDPNLDNVPKTGVTAEYGDQLLTLVTCAYHTDNGRFVVVARKITQ